MKNRSLVFQLWLITAGIAAIFGIVLILLMPQILGVFFTNEIFSTIESAQQERFPVIREELRDQLIRQELGLEPKQESREDVPVSDDGNIRAVTHVVIDENGYFKSIFPLSTEVKSMIREGMDRYKTDKQNRFTRHLNGKELYFSVKFGTINDNRMYLISYMSNDYRDQLVKALSQRLILLIVIALVFAWIPAYFLAKYWTKPLVALQAHVRRFAFRDLADPVMVDRRDEIGRLAQSIESMRQQLKEHDETQQSVLQHISHELKTPVMVIQSYAQSLQDGILRDEQQEQAFLVIGEESERLQKRISDLLYMTKLDFLAKHKLDYTQIHLDELVESVGERMRWLKPELDWRFELQPAIISADVEQWQIVLENVFDNQVRYAARTIRVQIFRNADSAWILRIWNDGPRLEQGDETAIFEAFRKGTNGKFGLGLVIVKRIAQLHGVQVDATNADGGVAFTFVFSENETSH